MFSSCPCSWEDKHLNYQYKRDLIQRSLDSSNKQNFVNFMIENHFCVITCNTASSKDIKEFCFFPFCSHDLWYDFIITAHHRLLSVWKDLKENILGLICTKSENSSFSWWSYSVANAPFTYFCFDTPRTCHRLLWAVKLYSLILNWFFVIYGKHFV